MANYIDENIIWNNAKRICQMHLAPPLYDIWIQPLELLSFENGVVFFHVHTNFKRTIIQEHLEDVIRESLEEATGITIKKIAYIVINTKHID